MAKFWGAFVNCYERTKQNYMRVCLRSEFVDALGLNPLRSIVGRSPSSFSSPGHRALIPKRPMLRKGYPTLQPCACAHVQMPPYVLCACDCEQNDIQTLTCNWMGCMPRASAHQVVTSEPFASLGATKAKSSKPDASRMHVRPRSRAVIDHTMVAESLLGKTKQVCQNI